MAIFWVLSITETQLQSLVLINFSLSKKTLRMAFSTISSLPRGQNKIQWLIWRHSLETLSSVFRLVMSWRSRETCLWGNIRAVGIRVEWSPVITILMLYHVLMGRKSCIFPILRALQLYPKLDQIGNSRAKLLNFGLRPLKASAGSLSCLTYRMTSDKFLLW